MRLSVVRITIEIGSVAWMSLRELTDVLTALLFYDFLLSFILTGCDGCIVSFVQVHSICIVSDTLFTTDAAAGKVKLMTGLSGTTDSLEHLSILYDTFGITCKASTAKPITPEQVIQNLNTVDEYIKATAMNVKETNKLKENSTTNGPQGTLCQKTQTSIELLLNGVKSLMSHKY